MTGHEPVRVCQKQENDKIWAYGEVESVLYPKCMGDFMICTCANSKTFTKSCDL